MLATMFFSHGTPMLLGGDEFGRTQQGNNNAYCQDNELSWYDWKLATSEAGRELTDFVARLSRLREQHPTLRAAHFLRGDTEVAPGMREVAWFDESGAEMTQATWGYTEGRLLALRRAQAYGEKRADVTLVLMNATPETHVFHLPEPMANWRMRCNSASPAATEVAWTDTTIAVAGHSVILLGAIVRTEPV
jgi:glycogen operon protein